MDLTYHTCVMYIQAMPKVKAKLHEVREAAGKSSGMVIVNEMGLMKKDDILNSNKEG